MMTLPFLGIYILAVIGSLVILLHKFLDFRTEEEFRSWVILIAVIELVIGGVINALWLKQPFLAGLLLPIALTTLILVLAIPTLISKVAKYDWGDVNEGMQPLWYKVLRLREYKFHQRIYYITVIAFISSISFAVLTSNLLSLLDFTSTNQDSILLINRRIFVASAFVVALVTLLIASINIIEKAVHSRRKK